MKTQERNNAPLTQLNKQLELVGVEIKYAGEWDRICTIFFLSLPFRALGLEPSWLQNEVLRNVSRNRKIYSSHQAVCMVNNSL